MMLIWNQTILARQPKDLTVAWAQRVVSQHDTTIEVTQVELVSVDIGTTTRIKVYVEHNKPHLLPKQWFVKLPSLAWQARLITALPRLLQTEVRFYKEMASVIPLNIPRSIAAESQIGRGAILVLSDLHASGALPGKPGDALNFEEAAMVVKQLANFHARFWNKVDHVKKYQWMAGPIRRLEDFLGSALAVPLMKRGLRLAGDIIPQRLHAPALNYAKYRKQAMRFLSNGSQTLVHHDCHPGNLFWHRSKPGLLDWQLVRFGEGISDIAYFLATALTPELRRLNEMRLLAIYAQELSDNGVLGIDLSELLLRYRAHLIYPFEAMVLTLSVGGLMDVKSNKELIRRAAAAVDDLDALSALQL